MQTYYFDTLTKMPEYKCFVTGCKSKYPRFSFPKDNERQRHFLEILGITNYPKEEDCAKITFGKKIFRQGRGAVSSYGKEAFLKPSHCSQTLALLPPCFLQMLFGNARIGIWVVIRLF